MSHVHPSRCPVLLNEITRTQIQTPNVLFAFVSLCIKKKLGDKQNLIFHNECPNDSGKNDLLVNRISFVRCISLFLIWSFSARPIGAHTYACSGQRRIRPVSTSVFFFTEDDEVCMAVNILSTFDGFRNGTGAAAWPSDGGRPHGEAAGKKLPAAGGGMTTIGPVSGRVRGGEHGAVSVEVTTAGGRLAAQRRRRDGDRRAWQEPNSLARASAPRLIPIQ